jgi:AraC-like DNA-binding protein
MTVDEDQSTLTSRNPRAGFPSLNQRIFAPFKIATVIDTVAGRGIDAATVLERTGLTLAEVRDPHTLTSIGQYLTACENIVAAGRLGWRTEGEVAVWQFHEIYRDVMSNDVRTFLIRQQMKMTYTHIRDAAGSDNVPVRARFTLPEEARSAEDERELSCPCFYAADANELHYPIGILEQTPELGNRLTRTMLEETCDRLIGQSRISSGLSGEVYQLLLLAPNHFPSMTAIAEQIGLQERTLRRRLAAEDTSYGEIVDDVRRKLAIEYLQTTRMSVDDVAWKVGFSDSANLRRAVRRWTGKTINEVRSEK